MALFKRVATYELPVLVGADGGEELRFVIETLRDMRTGEVLARLSRREWFRLTSGMSSATQSDEEIVVEDAFWAWERNRYPDEARAVAAVLAALAARLDSDLLRNELEAFQRQG